VPTDPLTRAFELALESRAAGDHPFGALLVVDGVVVAEAHNRVTSAHDITAHAETELVRVLEREGRLDALADGVVYASCEPCPQCVGALFWAGAGGLVPACRGARAEISTAPTPRAVASPSPQAELAAATTRSTASTAFAPRTKPRRPTTASGSEQRNSGRPAPLRRRQQPWPPHRPCTATWTVLSAPSPR
jgi:tRNA(Arg) A34 adenosine deaminase TadA